MNQAQSEIPQVRSGKTQGKTKAGTVAERVVWMTRTSDIHGSHLKTDLDSYLALIRRKIQEKVSTTAELINQIRRNKIGESRHVTPNEFRFTLIKFGVILPQTLVDRIFNVFDSDRSGTMDFDEFAMWIMNSEFRPAMENKTVSEKDSPRYILRKKLLNCVTDFPRVFENMKKQISFLELVSDINRTGMPLSERDARSIFLLLDPVDSGFIESAWLVQWAQTGCINRNLALQPAITVSNKPPPTTKEVVNRVIGWNTRQLELAFEHIVRGQGTRLPFEEFRRCLLNGGVAKNMADVRQLYAALEGDVDLLFSLLAPLNQDDEGEDGPMKRAATAQISTSRADRRLRDAVRKCHKEIKAEIEATDPANTGFIAAPILYKILVKRCMPLTFQDFRFIIQQIKRGPGERGEGVDYHHFLHGYNPLQPVHQLEGLAFLKRAATLSHVPTVNTLAGTGSNLNDSVSPASSMRLNSFSTTALMQQATNSASNTAANSDLRKIWQSVLKECHRADPDRTGQINRVAFIRALEAAKGSSMTAEAMNKLADQYILSNGLVNYLLLFRQYLGELTSSSQGGMRASTAAMGKSRSVPELSLSNGGSNPHHPHHDSGPVHPWEFTYKREKHMAHPYWHDATAVPREHDERALHAIKLSALPSSADKDADSLNPQEKAILLSQYQPPMIQLAARCAQLFAPIFRQLRAQLKKAQIVNQKGSILTTHFINILEFNGIQLRKDELGLIVKNFRGMGMQDIVRYDDFLRVCMLVKDRPVD
jgi:hypothetical protein